MIADINIYLYCKIDTDKKVAFMRAYKYLENYGRWTPSCQEFVYSHKVERYIVANFFVLHWSGVPMKYEVLDRTLLRQALMRIGLDIR